MIEVVSTSWRSSVIAIFKARIMSKQIYPIPDQESTSPFKLSKLIGMSENPFSSPSPSSDVILVVEGHKLHLNKGVLAVVSPVFERMFYGNFKEKESSEISLPDKQYEDILEFLLCLYPTTFKSIEKAKVETLLMLADEYQVQGLFERCVAFLKSERSFTEQEKVHFLLLAENNDNLKPRIFDFFLDEVAKVFKFSKQMKDPSEFSNISEETRTKVLMKRLVYFEEKFPNTNFTQSLFFPTHFKSS